MSVEGFTIRNILVYHDALSFISLVKHLHLIDEEEYSMSYIMKFNVETKQHEVLRVKHGLNLQMILNAQELTS